MSGRLLTQAVIDAPAIQIIILPTGWLIDWLTDSSLN